MNVKHFKCTFNFLTQMKLVHKKLKISETYTLSLEYFTRFTVVFMLNNKWKSLVKKIDNLTKWFLCIFFFLQNNQRWKRKGLAKKKKIVTVHCNTRLRLAGGEHFACVIIASPCPSPVVVVKKITRENTTKTMFSGQDSTFS